MSTGTANPTRERLSAAIPELAACVGTALTGSELAEISRIVEDARRALDRVGVDAVAGMTRLGVFAEHGYSSAVSALKDLHGLEHFEARQRVVAAEMVHDPAFPTTAAEFDAGRIGVRHVEMIARLLNGAQLDLEVRVAIERKLASHATFSTPRELQKWGAELVAAHAEPVETEPRNELRIRPFTGKPGGRIEGRFEDPLKFAAIKTVVDALSGLRDADDQRDLEERQADALAEACTRVLGFGKLPETGGLRPQLVVSIKLDDLEDRAKAASVQFGGQITPGQLRQMACDAAVLPMVMNGESEPLDVGRARRTVYDKARRAVIRRDGGCAHPGCGAPPTWCHVHHIVEWQHGGPTDLDNLVMLCQHHHTLVHQSGWEIRMVNGWPEFIPPVWIDPEQTPRRRRPPELRDAG